MDQAFAVILFAAVVYGTVTAWVFMNQGKIVFRPTPILDSHARTPAQLGLEYEDVWLPAEDGLRVHGWFVPAHGVPFVLLYCHGNTGNLADRVDNIEHCARLGINVLAIDYRGYGLSPGRVDEDGTRMDADAAWRWLVEERGFPPERIIVMGRSLGGAIAARTARDHGPAALILETPFSSMPAVARDRYPLLPARILCRFRFETSEYVRDCHCPLLVIYSPDDELIRPHHAERIYAAARGPRRLFSVRGGHGDVGMIDTDRYLAGISDFLANSVPEVSDYLRGSQGRAAEAAMSRPEYSHVN